MGTSEPAEIVEIVQNPVIPPKRQQRNVETKRQLVEATLVPGASVARVARTNGVIDGDKLHADDTPVPVLAPGTGKTKTGRLWTYVRDDRASGSTDPPAVWFAYSPDRKGDHPQQHLRDFSGSLQADAYAGFNPLYEGGRIQEVACWAHVRRKFYDLDQAHASPLAKEALQRIGELYAIESEIRGRLPEERRVVRQARSQPFLDSMRAWFESRLPELSRKSDTTAAIRYTLALWDALGHYIKDGRLEIDNTPPSGHSELWRWAARTTYLRDRISVVNVPLRFTA